MCHFSRALIVITLVTAIIFGMRLPATAVAAPLSLAVLPPADLNKTGIPDLSWLSIGIQESMTVDLWKVPDLRTLALSEYIRATNDLPQAVSRYDEVKAIELGRKLGINQIWRGEFLLSENDKINISFTAFDIETSKQLFSESIEGNLADVPQLTGQLVFALLQRAKITITGEARNRISSIKTVSRDAFKYNSRGFERQNDLSRGKNSRRLRINESIDYLNESVKADPDYAEAWINLGWAYQANNSGKLSMEAFTKAVTLKPYLLDAWMGIGYEERSLNNTVKAIAAFNKAIELNPSLEWPRRELVAITKTTTPSDEPQLLNLAEDPNLDVRLTALKRLASIKKSDSIPILEQAIERPDQAVEVLSLMLSVKPSAALPYLIEALVKRNSTDGSRLSGLSGGTLKKVIRKFVQFQLRSGIPALINVLSDTNAVLRENALVALADMDASEAVIPIRQMLDKEQTSTVRATALVALIRLGDNQARQDLLKMLNDGTDRNTTNYAIQLLKKRKIKL